MSSSNLYLAGYYFGMFLFGGVIGGVIPMLIFIMKKRWQIVILCPIICGILTIIKPYTVLIGAIIMIAVGCIIKKKDPYAGGLEDLQEKMRKEKEIENPAEK